MLDVLGSGLQPGGFGTDLQQSPGPSSRRGEEAEAVSQALLRLGVLFQFKVYLYANDSLRSESNVWTEALKSLMGSGSSSTICMQVCGAWIMYRHMRAGTGMLCPAAAQCGGLP